MEPNDKLVRFIRQIVRCFETGRVVGANFGAIAIMPDGPGNRIQLTYGASQTTEFGKLPQMLREYVEAGGQFSQAIRPFLRNLGNRSLPSISANQTFLKLLRDAAADPIMQTVQDKFFYENYFEPAVDWWEDQGFTLPLSLLVIYDSYTHSGSILSSLRNRFPTPVPRRGGNEKEWITNYVNHRDNWLETHASKLLQNTDYRTDSFTYAIRNEQWMLDKPFQVVNYRKADESDKPEFRQLVPLP